MLATIVTSNPNTAQFMALVAVILFIVAAVIALMTKTIWAVLLASGLTFTALALLFLA